MLYSESSVMRSGYAGNSGVSRAIVAAAAHFSCGCATASSDRFEAHLQTLPRRTSARLVTLGSSARPLLERSWYVAGTLQDFNESSWCDHLGHRVGHVEHMPIA